MKTTRLIPIELVGSPQPRAGTSLTEVLMSLLIMSIGVVSVATLFPISAMRTLEANKQTNSTLARFFSESLVDVDPQLIHNPDGVFPPGGADATPYNSASSTVPLGTPPAAAVIVPTFRGQNYLVDPIGWQGFNESGTAPGSPIAVTAASAYVSPRDFFGNNQPATVNWPLPHRYVGASLFPIPYPTTAAELIAARVQAATLATQPDNWKLVSEAQILSASPSPTPPYATPVITSLGLDNDVDLSTITEDVNDNGTLDPGEDRNNNGVLDDVLPGVRAVIFDVDGTHSETRDLISVTVSPPSIAWATTSPLPTRFNVSPSTGASPNLGKVRIEQRDLVYTWMLTVRKRPSGPASVDVVVFFKRNFDPAREQVFSCEFRKWKLRRDAVNDFDGTTTNLQPGIAGVDDDGNGVVDDVIEIGYPVTNAAEQDYSNSVVTLKVPSSATDDERPKPHRGGYIFDTKNGLWYRIRAIQNQQTVGTEDWVDLVLDETIKLDNTEDLIPDGGLTAGKGEDLNGDSLLTRGGAIVHPNVVNVFPLEFKEPF